MPTFSYALELLPPGRWPFRRWRWELWDGALLLAAGWTTAEPAAQRAVMRAASRRVHELLGVQALRPERARLLEPLGRREGSRLDAGAGTCLLVRRERGAVAARGDRAAA